MSSLTAAVGAAAASTQQAMIGAEVVTKTLDTLNQYGSKSSGSGSSDMAASYDFNKSVL